MVHYTSILISLGLLGGVIAHPNHAKLEKRQTTSGSLLCGVQNGGTSCPDGYCCNEAGICGTDTWDCVAPSCQFQYGSSCDANYTPPGEDTTDVPRPSFGPVPFGITIRDCLAPGVVALTFDDGPYPMTDQLIDTLNAAGIQATFFMTGNNGGKNNIGDPSNQYHNIVKKAFNSGHQIASHTWSHQDLNAISSADRKLQLIRNEIAIYNTIGLFPTYMRPPYLNCNADCLVDMKELGYRVVQINLDTNDWQLDWTQSKLNFDAISNGDPLTSQYNVLAHDIIELTVTDLVPYMIAKIQQFGYQTATIGDCLGDPPVNWYRDLSGNAAGPGGNTPKFTVTETIPTNLSPDGTCGGNANYTCGESSPCCSIWGWCGIGASFCDVDCLPANSWKGKCGTSISSTKSAFATVSATASALPSGLVTYSTDGTCGGTKKYTCLQESGCCSEWGWCGDGADFCNASCQSGFSFGGKCVIQSAVSSSSIASSTSSIVSSSSSSATSSKVSSSSAKSSSSSAVSSSSSTSSSTKASSFSSSSVVSSVVSSSAKSSSALSSSSVGAPSSTKTSIASSSSSVVEPSSTMSSSTASTSSSGDSSSSSPASSSAISSKPPASTSASDLASSSSDTYSIPVSVTGSTTSAAPTSTSSDTTAPPEGWEVYSAPNGKTFVVPETSDKKRKVKRDQTALFQQCLDSCAVTANCVEAIFNISDNTCFAATGDICGLTPPLPTQIIGVLVGDSPTDIFIPTCLAASFFDRPVSSSSIASSSATSAVPDTSSSTVASDVSSLEASSTASSEVLSETSYAASLVTSSEVSSQTSSEVISITSSEPSSTASSVAYSETSEVSSTTSSEASLAYSETSSVAISATDSVASSTASAPATSTIASLPTTQSDTKSSTESSKKSSTKSNTKFSTKTVSTKTSSASAKPTGKISPDNTCGGRKGYICPSKKCCSEYGWCKGRRYRIPT